MQPRKQTPARSDYRASGGGRSRSRTSASPQAGALAEATQAVATEAERPPDAPGLSGPPPPVVRPFRRRLSDRIPGSGGGRPDSEQKKNANTTPENPPRA